MRAVIPLILLHCVVLCQACTMILIGKNATSDGSVIAAHTDDAGGGATDLRLVVVPAADHPKGSMRPVYNFKNGYPRLVVNDRGEYYKPKGDQKLSIPMGHIPQVEHTFSYWDHDYGLQNEHQLTIAESTCAAKTVGYPLDKPYGKALLGIAELSKIALERCDNARCAVKTIGELAVKYGFFSEDSGTLANPGYADSAESLGIADKYGEVWMFHVLTDNTGASAIWAAQRVPDNDIAVCANGFVIRQMNLDDEDNFMASDNVHSVAQEEGWWNPETDGPFDFYRAYGEDEAGPIMPFYLGRRVWRVYDLTAPSKKFDPYLGQIPSTPTYPFSTTPDFPLSPEFLMDHILIDSYEGTEFDMRKGIAAGPFGNPVRWDGPLHNLTTTTHGGWERPISIFRGIFSFVGQARPDIRLRGANGRELAHGSSDPLAGRFWFGLDEPSGAVYLPFYCAQTRVLDSYTNVLQSKYSRESAWWAFNFINNWRQLRYNTINPDVRQRIKEMTGFIRHHTANWEQHALNKEWKSYSPNNNHNKDENLAAFLQHNANSLADYVVDQWWDYGDHLIGKYSDGYVCTGEDDGQQIALGYPKEWLSKMDSFMNFPPGPAWVDPPPQQLAPPDTSHTEWDHKQEERKPGRNKQVNPHQLFSQTLSRKQQHRQVEKQQEEKQLAAISTTSSVSDKNLWIGIVIGVLFTTIWGKINPSARKIEKHY